MGKADPEAVLRSTLAQLEQNRPRLDYEEPILAELDRLLTAMETEGIHEDMKLEELFITSHSASARLVLADNDALTGPLITDRIGKLPGHIVWTGNSRGGIAGQTTRTWDLSGVWTDRSSRRRPDGRIVGGPR
jgi:hypothetical protein